MYWLKLILSLVLFSIDKFLLVEGSGSRNNTNFYQVVNDENLKWIEQPLDHFDVNEKHKIKIRYYEDKRFWKPNRSIYLLIGGESDDPGVSNYSLFVNIAQETNSLVVLAEHRYYGESVPELDLNCTENYRYLTSRQALADLANLIESIKSKDEDKKNSKVIVMGCSYPGMLAVWMRLLYPNIVDAAVASCALMNLKVDAYEVFEKIADDYKKYGSQACYNKIGDIFSRYENLFSTPEGIDQLKKEENICKNVDMSLKENKEAFFSERIRAFAQPAQFGSVKKIQENCTKLLTGGKFDPPDPIFNNNEGCFDYSFANYVNAISKLGLFFRSWWYQLCTELGIFPPSNSDNQPFTKSVPLDFYIKQCMILFGPDFDEERVTKGVESTNRLYGGQHPNVTKVLFVNGEADLWSPLVLSEAYSDDVEVIMIPNSFHCENTRLINSDDSKELKDAKQHVIDTVKKWSI